MNVCMTKIKLKSNICIVKLILFYEMLILWVESFTIYKLLFEQYNNKWNLVQSSILIIIMSIIIIKLYKQIIVQCPIGKRSFVH